MQTELLGIPAPAAVGEFAGLPQLYSVETYRVQLVREPGAQPLVALTSSEAMAKHARAIYRTLDADKEHFSLLMLNNKNRLIGFKVISTGTLTQSLVHPREVWRSALYMAAAAVAFVHNHPSGDPAPSPEDIDVTKRLKQISDVIGIRVLDHVILGAERYYSFSDQGLL